MQTLEMVETEVAEIERIFESQKKNQYNIGNTSVAQRKAKLQKLHDAVWKYRADIQQALYNDFGKHPAEVDLSEIYPVIKEIKHARRRIGRWLGKNRKPTPLALMGASSRIKYEPKGVVLIISPWNFPLNLTFGPLVSAIAGGNCVMIKPSEMTPHISALMGQIIKELFEESEVAVIEGSVKTAEPLLEMPFNHIFFTGSPTVGKIVMSAAAKHLASVTLELGGKSPTIVDETADIAMAARRIAWGKYLNNGQICIAPDYVLVHESRQEELQTKFKEVIGSFYGDEAAKEPSYNRIVNQRHYNRLKGVMEDAFNKGANVLEGGKFDDAKNFISPTILNNVSMDSKVMNEEIFGPILPIITFKTMEEAIEIIKGKEKPLALYMYSKSKRNIRMVIDNTRAGGTCINHNAIHFFNLNLGFGGSNNSGIGRGHGDEGFKAFTNPRGVMHQHLPNALDMLTPPYNDFKQKLINLTLRWF